MPSSLISWSKRNSTDWRGRRDTWDCCWGFKASNEEVGVAPIVSIRVNRWEVVWSSALKATSLTGVWESLFMDRYDVNFSPRYIFPNAGGSSRISEIGRWSAVLALILLLVDLVALLGLALELVLVFEEQLKDAFDNLKTFKFKRWFWFCADVCVEEDIRERELLSFPKLKWQKWLIFEGTLKISFIATKCLRLFVKLKAEEMELKLFWSTWET